jgi:hypothetical protein
MTTPARVGIALVLCGTTISVIGVVLNNLLLNHIAAMQVWSSSNLLFAIYFYGRYKGLWDGGVSDEIMCGLYVFMLVSGLWGLVCG